jgi:hypothetical protein
MAAKPHDVNGNTTCSHTWLKPKRKPGAGHTRTFSGTSIFSSPIFGISRVNSNRLSAASHGSTLCKYTSPPPVVVCIALIRTLAAIRPLAP